MTSSKDDKHDKEDKNNSWLIAISFNIISDACPFSGRRMEQTPFFGSELVKNNCFHPMNKNWTMWPMWTMPMCKREGCPIRSGD